MEEGESNLNFKLALDENQNFNKILQTISLGKMSSLH